MKKNISLTVNGKQVSGEVEPRTTLVEFLRESLNLTGTHIGCDTSNCGACTVMLNGKSLKSCSFLAIQADGQSVLTVEGLETEAGLHPIQEAFKEKHGLQCGFCTPGMIMSAKQLLDENSNPSDDEIRHAIEGNFCRCTGYENIVRSIRHAANHS